MKRPYVFRAVLAFCVVLGVLVAARPTYADGPVQTVNRYDSWYTKDPSPDGPCSFSIAVHVVGVFHEQRWYDENGDLAREVHLYGGNRYYLHANGKTVTILNSGRVSVTYTSPEEALVTLTGQEWLWKIPGHGVVSGEVGNQTWSEMVDADGNLQDVIVHKLVGNILHTDVTPVLCEYLGP
ncbi:MAG: hypothetical protein GX620_14355 [Chloroflexi bacterium]|nr:hypothetical protein [Chloroflexota bacterium]